MHAAVIDIGKPGHNLGWLLSGPTLASDPVKAAAAAVADKIASAMTGTAPRSSCSRTAVSPRTIRS